ncbi:MAG TPA: glycosyltransferase [Bryobacteraceae bacterium]|nr:glycosyltransferase [Bryobacteraceae bacterium]
MAVRNSRPKWFRQAVDSMLAQIYPDWQLCIVDDASEKPVKPPDDSRISFASLEARAGISGALNRALAMANGDYIGVLDHDDFLSPDGLFRMVEALQQQRYEVLYSDEDYVDEKGDPVRPNLKPGWSPELLSNCMYVGHLVLVSRELMEKVGAFRGEFDGAQDYDLALRLTDQPVAVAHVPHILYHWRQHSESIAQRSDAKPWAHDSGRRAVEDMIRRRGWDAKVMEAEIPTRYHVVRNLASSERVSIVVPGRSGKSFGHNTDYENFEIVPDAGSAAGAYLVFLHEDVQPQKADWLRNLLAVAQRPEVGVVGAKLVYPNGAIQQSGIVLGMPGGAGYPGRGLYQSDYWRWLDYTRNVTAVSNACLVTRKQVFEAVGGFDAAFQSDLAAVDFCLRVREAGLEIILEQRACLIHEERDRIRPSEEEQELFRQKWHRVLAQEDRYYSRYLRLDREDTSVRMPTESASAGSTLER